MKIKVVDQSKLSATEISLGVQTINQQLQQWKKPWFGADHTLFSRPTTWDWEIIVVDDADVAEALGYHDVSPQGKPYGKVFVNVCEQYNVPWISVLSHEALEIVGDPSANMWAHDQFGKLWAYEMCDAVQDHLYQINGQWVSDFVLPNFFIPTAPPPYDYMNKLTSPFQVKNGYSIVAQLGTVSQIFGLIKRQKKHTEIVADEVGTRVLERPDKKFVGSRTQRRLHQFDQ